MKTENIKGFRDYTGEEAEKREAIRKMLVETFEKYGFEPAETPVIEYEDFVKGENEKDEAVSDTYRLRDKGDRKLALRYEFTFQLKRLMKNKKLPYKRYQIGEVFRDEPISANRTRQFTTCEADVIGSDSKDEAEIITISNDILNKVKSPEFTIYVNNRKIINEILDELGIDDEEIEFVIREIDKLDKISEKEVRENLKRYNAEKALEIFKKPEKFFEKYKGYSEIKELKDYLKSYGVEIKFSSSLARGLSYYNGTIFEVKTKKMKESICGGGAFMFNGIQCVGFGVSIERLSAVSKIERKMEKILVVSLGQDKEAIKLSQKLRKKGEIISVYYGKPSKALEYANSYNFGKVVFVGEKEVASGKYKIKDMKSGKETIFKV